MRRSSWPWLRVLAFALVIVGPVMVLNNSEALSNGDAVECDGSPMRPDQFCYKVGVGSASYDEEKRNEARGEVVGYAGVGLSALGIALFISIAIATRRGNR